MSSEVRVLTRFHDNASGAAGPDRWHSAYFRPRIPVSAGQTVSLVFWSQSGMYYAISGYLAGGDVTLGDLRYPQDTSSFFNGAYDVSAGLSPGNRLGGIMWGFDPIYVRQH